jgi:hypothetical protein
MTNIFSLLDGIIKAQLGDKHTSEMKKLLTWKCHVRAIVVGHGTMVGHIGDVSFTKSMVLKTIEKDSKLQQITNKVIIWTNIGAPRNKLNKILRIGE